ncbi:lysozyme [Mesorhizobium waimense]|uniref:lysozyme n=1 Tax=Mesorhizobium waimense TaxID=1300307 RepID=UPI001FDFDAC7|nr:lysozyme [Mesorhizobium waimense]
MAIGLIGGFEGLRLNSYPDVVHVWTVCYGETRGVKPGMKFTKSECDAKLAAALVEFETGMRKCLVAPDAIPDKPYAAFLSLSYNIGTTGFCKSSVARYANAGNMTAACNALLGYNKGGRPLRVIKGLDTRRKQERALCLEGIN